MDTIKENPVQKQKFQAAANKLLNHCFLVKRKEDNRKNYIFVQQYRELFNEYFDLLGYGVDINESNGVIALVNTSGTGRLRLNKVQSIFLLILRLLYIEKRKELSLNDDVVVLMDEIHQKYNMLQIDAKKHLDKTMLRGFITLFRRYHIVDKIDTDVTLSDTRLRIYPSVLLAVPNDGLNTVYDSVIERLNSYVSGGEQDHDEEADEEADED
ncbi:MAG: DUF4194 domain-containing protein [Bacillota bacterium]|nr:DUF4194 domain-containing protein [Bacillota bacterium]MDW7676760.1 DUF4194 domain-containing protein [Bacillota bacterium]